MLHGIYSSKDIYKFYLNGEGFKVSDELDVVMEITHSFI